MPLARTAVKHGVTGVEGVVRARKRSSDRYNVCVFDQVQCVVK